MPIIQKLYAGAGGGMPGGGMPGGGMPAGGMPGGMPDMSSGAGSGPTVEEVD